MQNEGKDGKREKQRIIEQIVAAIVDNNDYVNQR